MKRERRWLKSALAESKKPHHPMPWARKAKPHQATSVEKRRAAH